MLKTMNFLVFVSRIIINENWKNPKNFNKKNDDDDNNNKKIIIIVKTMIIINH
jgi:hypothetical protein